MLNERLESEIFAELSTQGHSKPSHSEADD